MNADERGFESLSPSLPQLLLAKVREQVERTQHLLPLIPRDTLDWQPLGSGAGTPEVRSVGSLLGHILDCLAGICATLFALHSAELAHFTRLRTLPVNHRCAVDEARGRICEYMEHIEEGFALLTNEELERRIPTVFVPDGEAVFTVLLGNLEHLINHKFQLFFYLKMLGVQVGTRDLYHLRGQ